MECPNQKPAGKQTKYKHFQVIEWQSNFLKAIPQKLDSKLVGKIANFSCLSLRPLKIVVKYDGFSVEPVIFYNLVKTYLVPNSISQLNMVEKDFSSELSNLSIINGLHLSSNRQNKHLSIYLLTK